MEKQKVSTKKRIPISEVTGLLRDFADGFDNGKITLEQDGNILINPEEQSDGSEEEGARTEKERKDW